MLPQKPSRKSQYVKPENARMRTCFQSQTRLRPAFPSLPFASLITLCLPLFVAVAGASFAFYETITSRIRSPKKQKHKQKQNKTKPTRIESRRVELSWTTRSEFEFNAKWPSSWPSWPTRLVAHSRLLQRCCVARWPMHKPRAQWSKTVSHLTNGCLRILLM